MSICLKKIESLLKIFIIRNYIERYGNIADYYNSHLSQIKLNEFKLKYPQMNVKAFEYIAQYGDLNDFRLLCNMLQQSGYEYTYFDQDYTIIKNLVDMCNRRVDQILGEEYTSFTYRYIGR